MIAVAPSSEVMPLGNVGNGNVADGAGNFRSLLMV